MIQKPLTAKDLLKYKTDNPLKWAIKFGEGEIKKEAQEMLELLGQYNHQGIPFPPGYDELVEKILGGAGYTAPIAQTTLNAPVVSPEPTTDPILSGELTETPESTEENFSGDAESVEETATEPVPKSKVTKTK